MRQATARGRDQRHWRAAGIGLAALCLLLAVALRTSESARGAEGDCPNGACVILIQVDGLEPRDVTPQTTPYLWGLAHPKLAGSSIPSPGLGNRSGFIWQAPRGVVSTGTASATASLLTGAYPEKTGVPADDFYGPAANAETAVVRQRLTAGGFGDRPSSELADSADPISSMSIGTILTAAEGAGGKAAVFLGDPGLATLSGISELNGAKYWFPPGKEASATEGSSASTPEGQYTGDPRLCPIPRYPEGGNGTNPDSTAYDPSRCPANDLTTASKAASDLQGVDLPHLTFIHLAELGAAKRLAGRNAPVVEDTPPPPDPAEALSHADRAVGSFVERYAQANPDRWSKTVLMVVGSHGYQTTPLAKRVPDPTAATDVTKDLTNYINAKPDFRFVPQGTFGTVYYTGSGDRVAALRSLKTELETAIKAACLVRVPSETEGCIDGIFFVDKDTPNEQSTLALQHPTWRLDARNPKTDYRIGGDLVITLKRGWAFGRTAAPPEQVDDQEAAITNANPGGSGGPQERAVAALVNGPSQSGQTGAVRNLDTLAPPGAGPAGLPYYPVSNHDVDPSDENNPPPANDPRCPSTQTDFGGLACANKWDQVGDDADDTGHQAQPVTVDFALTITALMGLPFDDPNQLQGRTLQEAFLNKIEPPREERDVFPPTCFDTGAATVSPDPVAVELSCVDEQGDALAYEIVSGPANGSLGPVVGNQVTYTPASGFSGTDSFTYRASSKNGTSDTVGTAILLVAAPPVVIKPKGFDFYGLLRDVKALVVDSRNNPYRKAKAGSLMSSIRMEADFGKPETAATLTFYRRSTTSGARSSRVVKLKPIARFDPFVVKRGHVVMRFKIPPQFKPTHLGITVREIARVGGRRLKTGGVACTPLKTTKRIPFRCTGPSASRLLAIGDAVRLHKRKPGRRAPARRG